MAKSMKLTLIMWLVIFTNLSFANEEIVSETEVELTREVHRFKDITWTSVKVLKYHESKLLKDQTGASVSLKTYAKPNINSTAGVMKFMGAAPLEVNQDSQAELAIYMANNSVFQQVEGVPDLVRYQSDSFDELRASFSLPCKNAVQNYDKQLSSLVSSTIRKFEDLDATPSSTYESECLLKSDELPLEFKSVVGVFVTEGKPFCTGTIVASRTILTSKHCFINSDGTPADHFINYKSNRVSFNTLTPHNGLKEFRVVPPSRAQEKAMRSAYSVAGDKIEVASAEKFTQVAQLSPFIASDYTFPIETYLIGSNINIDDLNKFSMVQDYVRGVGPEKSCAILEATVNGCLYHSCQSSKSTSGAGLLIKEPDTNIIKIIGVHKGPLGLAKGCESQPPLDAKINLAISL